MSSMIQCNDPDQQRGVLRSEHRIHSWDGAALYYRQWQPGYAPRRAVLILHDLQEHSGYYADLAEELVGEAHWVFAWDARGGGRSALPPARQQQFHHWVRDLEFMVRLLQREHAIAPDQLVVLGQGFGAAVLCAWLQDYAPALAGAVLGSPHLGLRRYGKARLGLLRCWRYLHPDLRLRSYLRLNRITHDAGEAAARRDDPFIVSKVPAGLLLSQQAAVARVQAGAAGIETPVLMLTGARDPLLDRRAQRRYFERLGSLHKVWQVLPGSYQSVFHETDRGQARGPLREFLAGVLQEQGLENKIFVANAFGGADPRRGPGAQRPAPWQRADFVVGRGRRLARDTGIGSGHHLEFVCRQQGGGNPLQRAADRWYLRRDLCQALRARHGDLLDLLRDAATGSADGRPALDVLDLGGAPGGHLRDLLAVDPSLRVRARCLDCDRAAVDAGRRLVAAAGHEGIEFLPLSSLEPEDWPALDFEPRVVIACGVLERFCDNAKALRLLRAALAVLPADGRLLVSNLLPAAAAALKGRPTPSRPDRADWYPRPQSEANRLLRLVGFVPLQTRVERRGICSVTLAGKRAAQRAI